MIVNRQRRNAAVAAVAQGLVLAANNAGPIVRAGRNIRKMYEKKKSPQSKTFTGNSSSYAGGNDFTSSKRTVNATGKKRVPKMSSNKMMYSMLQTTMPKHIYRFNNLSNYDTNVGALYIGNHRNTVSGEVTLPLHIYDLTSFPNQAIGAPAVGNFYKWASTAAGSACYRNGLPGTTSDGAALTTGWQDELGTVVSPVVQQAFHQWTDVRFNFYGARKRTTWFEVMFIRVHDELAHPFAAADTNVEYLKLMQYLERPLIWSNLQTDAAGSAYTKYKLVKRMKYFVSASQTTDVDTSVGNIKEAKIFLKHNKRLDYDWSASGASALLPHAEGDGVDFVRDSSTHNFPKHKERLLMVVRAFAPERQITATTPVPNANIDPTYDIIIRNAFVMPPKHST